jgi:ribonuclease G
MTTDILIVRVRPGEVRIALLDTKKAHLKDFALYRTQSAGAGAEGAEVGDVYLGRVKKVIPAMEAAFVDIGHAREGFLGLSDARLHQQVGNTAVRDRISDYVREGDVVTVQVLAEARDDKGPKLSRRISVIGSLCVLTPGDPGVRVSKRVGDDVERNRLRAALAGTLGNGNGCVVRSGAQGANAASMKAEIELLQARWSELHGRADAAHAPARLSADDLPPIRFLTEVGTVGLSKIVVDDPAMALALTRELEKLGIVLPGGVERHLGNADVFEVLGVADEVAGLMRPTVALKSGGSIIIEETAALTVIDVNSGGSAEGRGGRGADLALSTNLEAVTEAARQMRLRNLGGLIVMDLMALSGEKTVGRVVNTLKEAVAHDPAGPHVLGTTKTGLLEITRPRRRPPLSHQLLGPCPLCASHRAEAPLTVGLRALDQVLAEVWASPALIPALRAPKSIIMALQDDASDALKEMEAKLGQTLDLLVDDQLPPGTFRVEQSNR